MSGFEVERYSLKIIEKIEEKLRDVELSTSDYLVKEKIENIIEFIEKETKDNKFFLEEMIKNKINETRTTNPKLNTNFYMLYRNLTEGRITREEAKAIYDIYIKEIAI